MLTKRFHIFLFFACLFFSYIQIQAQNSENQQADSNISRWMFTAAVPLDSEWVQYFTENKCEVNTTRNQEAGLGALQKRLLEKALQGDVYVFSHSKNEEMLIPQDSLQDFLKKRLCIDSGNPNCAVLPYFSKVFTMIFEITIENNKLMLNPLDLVFIATRKQYRKDADSILVDYAPIKMSLSEVYLNETGLRKILQTWDFDWIPAQIQAEDKSLNRYFNCDENNTKIKEKIRTRDGRNFREFVEGLPE